MFHYSTNFHYRKDEPVKWSEVAGSGDTTVITTGCEAYVTVNQGHDMKCLNTQDSNNQGQSMKSLSPSTLLMCLLQNRKVEEWRRPCMNQFEMFISQNVYFFLHVVGLYIG